MLFSELIVGSWRDKLKHVFIFMKAGKKTFYNTSQFNVSLMDTRNVSLMDTMDLEKLIYWTPMAAWVKEAR